MHKNVSYCKKKGSKKDDSKEIQKLKLFQKKIKEKKEQKALKIDLVLIKSSKVHELIRIINRSWKGNRLHDNAFDDRWKLREKFKWHEINR